MSVMTASEIDFETTQMQIVVAQVAADELKLPSWGRWKRKGNSLRHLDYPPCVLDFRGRGSSSPELSAFIPEIDDDEGNRIELAVRALPKQFRMLITALYLAKVSVRELARQNHCTRGDIDQMHSIALGMLNEKLRMRA